MWNVQLMDENRSESKNRKAPWSVAFMPNSEQIVVGRTAGSVEALNASTGQEVVKIMEGDDKDQ